MFRLSETLLLLCLITVYQMTSVAVANAQKPDAATNDAPPTTALRGTETDGWSAVAAQHVAGLPGMKAKDKGTLEVTERGLVFNGKNGGATVSMASIVAVGTDNQRVELWGVKGRLLRMAIPQGGGLLAATMMHHRVDTLTVEFEDARGGYHAAVFYVAADAAQRVMQQLATAPVDRRERAANTCGTGAVRLHTVRVLEPQWNDVVVPAAYRALVYENLVERLKAVKGVEYVYRDGEPDAEQRCAAYTVALTATGYKAGSQVARSSTGPVGFFVGTTQLKFDVRITNFGGSLDYRAEMKATARGETESMKVADGAAKKLVKEFAKAEKRGEQAVVIRSSGRAGQQRAER